MVGVVLYNLSCSTSCHIFLLICFLLLIGCHMLWVLLYFDPLTILMYLHEGCITSILISNNNIWTSFSCERKVTLLWMLEIGERAMCARKSNTFVNVRDGKSNTLSIVCAWTYNWCTFIGASIQGIGQPLMKGRSNQCISILIADLS